MSTYTKINVRSPFFLHLTEPSPPLPEFDCAVANLVGFAVDNQGVITLPVPDRGVIDSISSDDGDFSNNKFPAENSDTSRTIKINLLIPTGFSNTSDIFFECPVSTTQPGTGAGGGTAVIAPCTGGPSTSGSIGGQTLTGGGSSADVDLAGFFTGETTYDFSNPNPNLVTVAISGSVLTLSPNAIAGTTVVYGIGRDGSYPTTCEAVQPISVTVNQTTTAYSCTSPTNPALQGGSITQAGVITKPTALGTVGTIKASSGGGAITSVAANSGTSAQDVTLFFDITVPSGYSNAGATVECSATFSQPGTSAPTFTCDLANLTGQSISTNGSVNAGTSALGTVQTPASGTQFAEVSTQTSRTITFPVIIPSGYNGANGTATINCDRNLIQPPATNVCGSNAFNLSSGKTTKNGHCIGTFGTGFASITSTAGSLGALLNSQVCRNGSPFDGKNLYYGVRTDAASSSIGAVGANYYVIQIDTYGIVQDLAIVSCDVSGGGTSVIV